MKTVSKPESAARPLDDGALAQVHGGARAHFRRAAWADKAQHLGHFANLSFLPDEVPAPLLGQLAFAEPRARSMASPASLVIR